jgi:hypothetical protein
MTRFWSNLHQLRSKSTRLERQIIQVFGGNTPKGLNSIAKFGNGQYPFLSVIEYGSFGWKQICADFFRLYCRRGQIQLSGGDDWISKTGLTPPNLCARPKPGAGFSTSYVVVVIVFSEFS